MNIETCSSCSQVLHSVRSITAGPTYQILLIIYIPFKLEVNLSLASMEAEDLIITLQALKVSSSEKGGLILMIMVMMMMMMMIMVMMMMMMIMMTMMMKITRMKTICDVMNKSRIKVKVMIM